MHWLWVHALSNDDRDIFIWFQTDIGHLPLLKFGEHTVGSVVHSGLCQSGFSTTQKQQEVPLRELKNARCVSMRCASDGLSGCFVKMPQNFSAAKFTSEALLIQIWQSGFLLAKCPTVIDSGLFYGLICLIPKFEVHFLLKYLKCCRNHRAHSQFSYKSKKHSQRVYLVHVKRVPTIFKVNSLQSPPNFPNFEGVNLNKKTSLK